MGWCSNFYEGRKRYFYPFLISFATFLRLRACSPQLKLLPTALKESKTEIRIQFKTDPSSIIPSTLPNVLTIRVQPNESVYLQINSNLPTLRHGPRAVATELDLTYRGTVSDGQIPGAYESLILDAVKGDFTHSVRGDELDASWRVFTPMLHHIDEGRQKLEEYAFGECWFIFLYFVIHPFTKIFLAPRHTYPPTEPSELISTGSSGPAGLDEFVARHLGEALNP